MNDKLSTSEKMLIEWECTKLVNRFNLLADSGQFADAIALFAEQGSYLTPAFAAPVTGRKALLDAYLARPPMTVRHFATNIVIDAVSRTEARGRSYLIVVFSNEPDISKAIANGPAQAGEVEEHFILTDEGWRIGHRRGVGSVRFSG